LLDPWNIFFSRLTVLNCFLFLFFFGGRQYFLWLVRNRGKGKEIKVHDVISDVALQNFWLISKGAHKSTICSSEIIEKNMIL